MLIYQSEMSALPLWCKLIVQFLGTGTTYRATHSFVAILTNNPELQKRLQQEVDEAVGDETPRLADKEKMPYLEAVRGL